MAFKQGHALIIGVGSYPHIFHADVPIAVEDAQAVEKVIRDEKLCAYPESQVESIADGEATRQGTLDALDRLAKRAGEGDTVFLYYCGHGALGDDGNFYLVSYNARVKKGRVVAGSGVSEAELLQKLRALKAKRVLLIFNTCFSGSISPTLSLEEPEIETGSLTEDMSTALLATGSGRIIITACREDQKSHIGTGSLSIFTQALVDGLRGRGVGNSSGYISAFSLYEKIFTTVTEQVPDGKQEPELTVIKGVGPFAVALYRGASTLGDFDESQPMPDTPAVRQVQPEKAERAFSQIIQVRDGAVAIGKGATAVGKGGIVIKGNVGGDVIGAGGEKITGGGGTDD